MTASAAITTHKSYRVLIVLPPDFEAPKDNRAHRFPPQAAALVAASVMPDGIVCRVVDLDQALDTRPFPSGRGLLDDHDRLHEHLRGTPDEEYVALGREMIERVAELAEVDVDAFALSIDRHTQVSASLLLGAELKRKFGHPVILGGANAKVALHRSQELGLRGIDIITTAETPREIRSVFTSLRELAHGRWEIACEPLLATLATPPDEWPIPDFSVYDLELYRRDPYRNENLYRSYDGSIGRNLVLPYHFSWDCQYACTFCVRGGAQAAKSVERAARDLATLAERFECRSFMLFDAQINLLAHDFAKALINVGANIHWTDSFRVSPRKPKDVLETMAKAGCIGLTFGVESVSDRMLKRMVKGHTAAQATSIIEDAHALGLFTRVNLLPCFPGETRADHEITRDWVKAYARQIDEVVPSSFYLATNSPVLKLTERYGIVVRGTRRMDGDYKFRKNFGSLEYDEIDGYTWEERAETLRPAEVELFESWREGRAGLPEIRQATQVFAVRAAYSTKASCYEAVARWCAPPTEAPVDQPQEDQTTATVSGASDVPLDDRATFVSSKEGAAPLTPSLPQGSWRARALAVATRIGRMRHLQVSLVAADDFHFALSFTDSRQHSITVCVEREHADGRYFKKGYRLGMWYQSEMETEKDHARWVIPVLHALGKLLLDPTFAAVANELSVRQPRQDQGSESWSSDFTQARGASPLPVYSVFDLVRLGLKPAAALAIHDVQRVAQLAVGLPAWAVSRFGFVRDACDNIVVVADADVVPPLARGPVQRMLYVADSQEAADRLRDIEEALYIDRDTRPPAEVELLHEQLGVALGFPDCCARAFARACRDSQPYADYYGSLQRLGWNLRAIDWRLNHVIARHYHLPFLIHVPCREECVATLQLVDKVVAGLYKDEELCALREILSQGAVVYSNDRFVLFRPRGIADAGKLGVSNFNRVAHPEVMGDRAGERSVGSDLGVGFTDAEVEAIRLGDSGIEVFAKKQWYPYAPSGASSHPSPILLTPGPYPTALAEDSRRKAAVG